MKPIKYIKENGTAEFYFGVREETSMEDLCFHPIERQFEDDYQVALHTKLGSLTVLDRMTGFGWRDIETGFRDKDGNFWLASGGYDVRESGAKTFGEAIQWVKEHANNCKGNEEKEKP